MKAAILDDDPFFLKLLAHQLRACAAQAGEAAEVATFDRAAPALAALSQSDGGIDLLLCDLQLPEMDGVEVLRHLRQMRFGGSLVLVSGEEPRTLQSAHQLARAHGLDVIGMLAKPVDPARLCELLAQVRARRGRTASPAAGATARAAAPEGLDPRDALRTGALINHYQPQVDLATGGVLGMEALVRWDHPVHGLLLPGQFLAAFAGPALDAALTRTVLGNALADMAAWTAAGYGWGLSVNMSLAGLTDLDLPERLTALAEHAGAPLERLCLELTEGHLLDAPSVQLDVLTRLCLRRVRLSIDDFGTGYSSLARLRDLPFGELKIDRGFVHGAAGDPTLQSFLGAALGLAGDLGMTAVAEGVEDPVDFDFLRSTGCHAAQGFLIARPMHPRLLGSWHSAWARRAPDLLGLPHPPLGGGRVTTGEPLHPG